MSELLRHFETTNAFPATKGQAHFFYVFERFWNSSKPNCCLLLNGYAGTGKTTVMATVAAYVRSFRDAELVQMAPTGKAAKVLRSYTGINAYTIHRYIYMLKSENGERQFKRKENKHKNALFIVDEASMISGDRTYFSPHGQSLLHDLVDFVKEGDNCKLLFVGDQAQLPPVHSNESPALDAEFLKNEFDLLIAKCSFDEVLRQDVDSGVLFNATNIRYKITGIAEGAKLFADQKSFFFIDPYSFLDHYEDALSSFGENEVVVLTKSNKSAVLFNQQIRSRVLGLDEIINGGDKLMVVKNNYKYGVKESNIDFIANGESIMVNRIVRTEEKYGMLFADADIHLENFEIDLQVKLNLSALNSNLPAVDPAEMEKLYDQIDMELLDEFPYKKDRKEQLRSNEYLNALQVKYAYAITGHKSQGGQWHSVFIDHGFVTEETIDNQWYRWLYTAITRSKTNVFLLNPAKVLL
jgi:exodeoxyribonuclease-5